ncbi:heterokaryon incompatibility protein-domain-containing protein [Cercophora newfieldiana]|uniref:Heterokaryon incompatibility protein-domain-containing protein n=1 Tax=Cercophora newfieldiana TaxID=92897 RepID=A0AA39YAD8_9PEZI|nr:heterokaryon incompatibility protein-domain-containing protein [Cercophora newfieldiana]
MGSATSYEYSPLPDPGTHIRLLSLDPAPTKDSPLHGSLSDAPLGAFSSRYEALSYVWGAPSPGPQLELFIGDKSLSITPNLSTALRYLRHPTQHRLLWVDAICINQHSNEEKTLQVRRMRDIYAYADHVVIFLGEGSGPDFEDAMDFLNLPESEMQSHPRKPLRGLAHMLALPWWSRMWVVQEVSVPAKHPTVMWGMRTAPWGAVRESIMRIAAGHLSQEDDTWGVKPEERFMKNPSDMTQFALLRTREGGPGEDSELGWLLGATKLREATDPRDKVFALVGVAADTSGRPGLEVDYSLGVSEVYQLATVYLITRHREPEKKMDFLLSALTRAPRFLEKPTWCIDFLSPAWGRAPIENNWVYLQAMGNASQGCCEGNPPDPVHDLAAGTLTVRGTVVGVIQDTYAISLDYANFRRRARETDCPEEEWKTAYFNAVAAVGTAVDDFTQPAIAAMMSRGIPVTSICEAVGSGLMWRVAASGTPPGVLCHLAGRRRGASAAMEDQVYGMLETYAQSVSGWRRWLAEDLGWAKYSPEGGFPRQMAADLLQHVVACASGITLFTTKTGFFGATGEGAMLMGACQQF